MPFDGVVIGQYFELVGFVFKGHFLLHVMFNRNDLVMFEFKMACFNPFKSCERCQSVGTFGDVR